MLALLLTIIPLQPITTDDVDSIEVNHMHADDGKHCFTQFIFWDWHARTRRFVVVDWRMSKRGDMPRYDRGRWRLLFWDGETLREVRAVSAVETWTQVDPEIRDRGFLPQSYRRKLGRW